MLLAIDASAPATEIAKYLESARILPAIGHLRVLRGTIDATHIQEIQSLPHVYSILRDRPVAFPYVPGPAGGVPPSANRLRFPYAESTGIERDSLDGQPEATMYQVVNFTGARRAWTQLGVNGTGVTIAVVDTGVDLGAMNLGDGAAARDRNGLPSSFDPDGGSYGRTTIRVTSYTFGGKTFVRTRGTDPLIYIFDLPQAFGPYGPANVSWSDPRLFNAKFPVDMEISSIAKSQSGTYQFGVLSEWHYLPPFLYLDLFPTLVVDASVAGAYDTAYLDLSFDWWLNGFAASPDFSFSDEPMLHPTGGNVVASRDMDGDGYPDVSAGSLGYGLDIWGLEPDPGERFRVLQPLDPDGDHIVMVYDWEGHGTSVAASAAGRETAHSLAGPGIAPGARIMAIPVFLWGDIIEGWLWAAGFDLVATATPTVVPGYFDILRYGNWTYTGNHKADIISNSWGISDWLTLPDLLQWPWYDVLTVLEDALTTPGYANPAYPGTLFVHAGGNGAAGYGTVTEPAFNSLALTVGASTSLNDTALPFGGFHNDVMSWSARGPNALGAPKPDVVMVGAFAYTSAPPWLGNGSGVDAVTLFGGTSQATPVTSGAAAVMIEAYAKAHGSKPSPMVSKAILKSTALDLGYDAFVQGAGHVNVFNAAAFAAGRQGFQITSPATWDNIRPRLGLPWATAATFYGQQINATPPAGPVEDTSWFAGSLRPGESTTAQFALTTASPSVSGTISAVWHTRIGSMNRTGTTANLGAGWLEGFGALVPLSPTDIPPGTDLILVRGVMRYSDLDSDGDYVWDTRSRIVVGDWVDANNDGRTAPNEVRIFSYGYNTGTTFEARVGLPEGRFAGRPLLWFSQVPASARPFAPIPFTIQVEFYQRVPWSWIAVVSSFSASAGSPATWAATLTVPTNANPGVYEGQILVTPSAGNRTAVPVSVVVPRVLGPSDLSAALTSRGSTSIYDLSTVAGYFDWRWRYEAGEWRLWFVDVTDPDVVALRVDARWSDPKTDVDIWSLTPGGVPGDSSFSPYLGNGTFRWSTRTGTTSDHVVVSVQSSLDQPGPGLYTFALHDVLFGGGSTPEPLDGSASVAKLSPRGPITAVTRPGTTVPLRFALSTGFDLHRLAWVPTVVPLASAFPASTSPSSVPLVRAGESRTLWANFTVPANASDGAYENFLLLVSDELQSVVVRATIVVDSTAPIVSIVAPNANAFVRGSVTIQATVDEGNRVGPVTFAAGATSGMLTQDPATGVWSAVWDTTRMADGPQAITITATDLAGNPTTASRTVTVDNTPPRVSIASPSEGARVSGTTTISWSVEDTNLDRVWLAIDGVAREVTGNTSFAWDTRGVADGSHRVEVRAADKAGNENVASVNVAVENLGAATTSALVTGLFIGLLVAAVVGFVLGWIAGRRRRRPPVGAPAAPQSPPPGPEPPQPTERKPP